MWIIIMGFIIVIQVLYLLNAFESMHYHKIKSSIIDMFISGVILMIAGAGGIIAFNGALIATFIITVYLKIVKRPEMKPQPWWWRFITRQK